MKDLVIFGTGGLGREFHELIQDMVQDGAKFNLLGFLDGNPAQHGQQVHDLPVLGDTSWLEDRPGVEVVLGVGNTAVKHKIRQQVQKTGHHFAQLIHPSVVVGRRVQLGEGVTICAGSLVTTDIVLEDLVTLNLDVTVGHDSILRTYVNVAPSCNISGNVIVGKGCDLGTNSTIIQGLTLGHWSILGAGAVMVKDLPANITAVGAPAKVIKEREPEWYVR